MSKDVELDELDVTILKELIEDGRSSFREIAKKLNTSVGTVASRVKRMESMGVIRGYTALIDAEKLGFELTAITSVTVSRGKLLEVQREIASLANTVAVYDVTGVVDSIVVSKFRNRQELSEFTKRILSIPYVERTNTHIALTIVKEDFRGLLKSLGEVPPAKRGPAKRPEVEGYG
ncbi:MAG: Lrp/AsnC family transcriptional regulator [Thaumarchaeota archaeon]|nr:Lrp/AsnC family transcriptional regulator [Candidatus Calditenuaceae archaeon]